MPFCPNCKSDRTNPVNIEWSVYECLACNRRFHKNGFEALDVLFQGSMSGTWPILKATLDRAKEGTE